MFKSAQLTLPPELKKASLYARRKALISGTLTKIHQPIHLERLETRAEFRLVDNQRNRIYHLL